ncbi:hypothetical protein HKCCE4037_04950 [Rhodobacterales bacterium HKCCE4037]|nr:hypothetical protein [Rhodobacterales bacterium HKCCE4037]
MSLVSFGDMAQFQTLRRQGISLRSDLARLTAELSSGKIEDKGRAVGGDFSTLADITRGLRLNETYRNSIANAAIFATGRQSALERVADELDGFGASLMSLTGMEQVNSLRLDPLDAPERFDAAVRALNTRVAGQSIFAADAPEATPLANSDTILTELRTVIAGATDAASVDALVTAWFNDTGGGYETFAWQGGEGVPLETLLGEADATNSGVSALDPAVRETLTALALATLASDEPSPLLADEREALIAISGQKVLNSETSLVALRARIGSEEAHIEEAKVAAEAARGAMELEYGRLVDADPYRTATELEAVTLQLESLYILTARMSRLNLTEFLR